VWSPAPGCAKGVFEFGDGELRKDGGRGASLTPRIGHERKGFWRHHAFELLLFRGERGFLVSGKGDVDALCPEGYPIKVRGFGRLRQGQRNATKIFAGRHWLLKAAMSSLAV
jgi:hypothetical protein